MARFTRPPGINLEAVDYWDRAAYVLGVLERGEDVDALMYAIGELGEMDQVLLLAQVAEAKPPEPQGRVDQFIEQASKRYLAQDVTH